MVLGRIGIRLLVAGIVLGFLQVVVFPLIVALAKPAPMTVIMRRPNIAGDVSVIWRDFRPGQREAAPSTTAVQLCAAALDRGGDKSALVLRFCNSQPTTPARRFAFGYDDLVVRARLPGSTVTLAYDLLEVVPGPGGSRFTEGPLPENQVTVDEVFVADVTDLVFVIVGELPLGLPTIEISGRYAGQDLRETVEFASLGDDLERTEAARVSTAPTWARVLLPRE